MNVERLSALADWLDKVDPKRFDLANWKYGTTACAVGHACDIPGFRKAGLYMKNGSPRFAGHTDWDAVTGFFSLWQKNEELYLFCADCYNPAQWCDPLAVSMRIREYVKNNEMITTET